MVSNPNFLAHLVIQWWIAGICLQILCLWMLIRRGQYWRHSGVTVWLVLSIAAQLYQLSRGVQSKTGYYYAYRETAWIADFALACLVAGVFYRAVVHFVAPVRLAAGMVAILGGVATVVAVQFAGDAVNGKWDRTIGQMIATRGNYTLGAAVFLLLSRAIFLAMTHRTLTINARRSLDATALLAGGTWVIYMVCKLGAPTRLENYSTVALHMTACAMWMLMRRSGDDSGMPVEPIAPSRFFREMDSEFLRILGKAWKRK